MSVELNLVRNHSAEISWGVHFIYYTISQLFLINCLAVWLFVIGIESLRHINWKTFDVERTNCNIDFLYMHAPNIQHILQSLLWTFITIFRGESLCRSLIYTREISETIVI